MFPFVAARNTVFRCSQGNAHLPALLVSGVHARNAYLIRRRNPRWPLLSIYLRIVRAFPFYSPSLPSVFSLESSAAFFYFCRLRQRREIAWILSRSSNQRISRDAFLRIVEGGSPVRVRLCRCSAFERAKNPRMASETTLRCFKV